MPYEQGGRADKSGNRYEIRIAIYQLLELLEEKIDYVILEALGESEQGVDIWIGHKNGIKEGMQCKGRNGSKEFWDYGSANSKNIFTNWKLHLDREPSIIVSLASPLSFTMLEDLIDRAIRTGDAPKDFYEHQVLSSSRELKSFFYNFCKINDIDPEVEGQLRRCLDYLNRIKYRQLPDSELKTIITSKINYLFLGNSQDIYDDFVSWIVDGEILGKTIGYRVLYEFLDAKDIKQRNLSQDKRIIPQVLELNKEYKSCFQPLSTGMIIREEFNKCRNAVRLGKSLIIHGKAGRGKSGCTEDLINYCEDENIQYLAVKLDKRIPNRTAEKWGDDLGLPASIVHCIHSVTKNEKAVIILDQLDALRWTQAHSRDALLVCARLVQQVDRLNLERNHNISLVFVCRTYDLENDNNIKGIFKSSNKSSNRMSWEKIHISELSDDLVKKVVGKKHNNLTHKLKELLRSISNLYIWQHLDREKEYSECSTTSNLVQTWWRQLSKRYFNLGYSESDLSQTKEELVNRFDRLGRICIPISIISSNYSTLEYLSSNGFLALQENRVSFAHQSILDCLLAEKMLKQYFSGQSIVNIIGDKENQTPGKRYQLQMLIQNLVEYNTKDFLNAGLEMLESDEIRFSNKYVFFEVLNQVDRIDSHVHDFIVENSNNKPWSNHIINNVVYSRVQFFRVLRDSGLINIWFRDPNKKEIVFRLLVGIRPNYDKKDVDFITQYAFKSQDDDYKFAQCFWHDINEDIDEFFELRMQFYQKYPQFANNYLDFKSMIENCELRTIKYFALLLENKIRCKSKNIHKYEDEFIHENSEFLIQNGESVLKLLLPYIPMHNDELHSYSDWSGIYNAKNIERVCINIVKKANAAIIQVNPGLFWEYYGEYLDKGNNIYNELILDAFTQLPLSFSDQIFSWVKCKSNFHTTNKAFIVYN